MKNGIFSTVFIHYIVLSYFSLNLLTNCKSNNFNQLITYLNFIPDDIGYIHKVLIKYTDSNDINAYNLDIDSSLWKYSEVRRKSTGFVSSEEDSKISDPLKIVNFQFSKLLLDVEGKHKNNYVLWTIDEENDINNICSNNPKTIKLTIRIKFFNRKEEAHLYYDNLKNITAKMKFVDNIFNSINGYNLISPTSISSKQEFLLEKFIIGDDQYLNTCVINNEIIKS